MVDGENHRIQVFTAKGKFLRLFGRCGDDRGELKEPFGLAIDATKNIYICKIITVAQSMFTSEGQFVTSLTV